MQKTLTVIAVILAVILAAGIGLLIWLESGRPEADTPETTTAVAKATEGTAQTAAPVVDPLPTVTNETENTEFQAPVLDIPEPDPATEATEGPEVDPTLGMDTQPDPTENELPVIPD